MAKCVDCGAKLRRHNRGLRCSICENKHLQSQRLCKRCAIELNPKSKSKYCRACQKALQLTDVLHGHGINIERPESAETPISKRDFYEPKHNHSIRELCESLQDDLDQQLDHSDEQDRDLKELGY